MSNNEKSRRRLLEGSLSVGILRFGLPLAAAMGLHLSFNLVDMFMISRVEGATDALAALGVCDMLAAAATILSTGIGTATVARIAPALGASDLRGVRRATWQGFWLVTVLSLLFGALGLFGSEFLVVDVMHVKGSAAGLAVRYLQVMLGGAFSICILLQVTNTLRALGHAKTSAVLLVSGNALNVVLNVLLVYGDGPAPDIFSWGRPLAHALDIPRLGVVGTAYATVIARTLPLIAGLWILSRRRGGPRFHRVYLRPMASELRALVRLAWPQSTQLVLRVLLTLTVMALVGAEYTSAEDPSTLTALGICLRLETLVLFLGMGWGAAASSFVGTNLGAGQRKRAKRAGLIAAGFDVALMSGIAFVFARYGGDFVGFFDPTPRVVSAGADYLDAVAWSYVFFGGGVVLSQAMSGAGATLLSLKVDAMVVLPLAATLYFVATRLEGVDPLWTTIALGNLLSGLAFIGVYLRGRFFGDPASSP